MSIKHNLKFITILFGLLFIQYSSALYEDQIKKFDWRNLHIGKLNTAYLDLSSHNGRLLVTTAENVLASLCPKTGEIQWRQILEKSPRGDINFSYNLRDQAIGGTAAARRNSVASFDLITVQGTAPAIVRCWSTDSGNIVREWSLMPVQPEKADAAFWFYQISLHHVIPVWGSHLEVTKYVPSTGQLAYTTTTKLAAPWISADKCLLSGAQYVCVEGSQLIVLDLESTEGIIFRKQLGAVPKSKPTPLKGKDGVLVIDGQLVAIDDSTKVCQLPSASSFLHTHYNQEPVVIQANVENHVLTINAFNLRTCESIKELENSLPYPSYHGQPELQSFDCKTVRNDGKGCVYILSTSDEAILAIQQSKIRWSREESLANIEAIEFIDLPLADDEGAIESEMKTKSGDIAGAFVRRITGQSALVKSILLHVLGLGAPPTDTQKAGLVRDSFGLHKMLVVLTKSGKVFGIDNISGKRHWMQYLPTMKNFENEQSMRLIVQRTSKHFPLPPLCAIVAKDSKSGNGLIFRFNPITGKPTKDGLTKLDYKIKQMSLLRETENDFVKGLLLLDSENEIHVVPETTKEMAKGMYIFTAEKDSATLNGYFVRTREGELMAQAIWSAVLSGGEHKIIAIASKNPIERVHSLGRVLGDRSVLYKYINPNLVAVVTQAPDSIHKYIMNVHLVDVVSGYVVFSMTHRKVRGPLHIIHSENWLAYTYYNDKVRRTEITTIELYEGKSQANSTVWSSLNAPTMPLVERQSFIIPTLVETLKETITERGITNKHILIGTSSGAIVEMPWVLLDPRRPITSPNQAREEGVIPYIPELPLPTENIINYNQTVARIRNIFTAPSGLESTCLVVATGLDFFVTRVSPSKTFDLLKEDFDYFLITIVLIALTTGSLVVKHLSARKILKQAWK